MKVRLNILFILLFTLISNWTHGQTQIVGKFSYSIADTTISLYKPIGGIYNKVIEEESSTKIDKSTFKVLVNIDKPGFVILESKNIPRTLFYTEPQGSIGIAFSKDESGKTKIKYSGSNANANNILTSNSPMDSRDFLQYRLPEIFQAISADAFLENLNFEIEKSTQPYKLQFQKGRITQKCYEAMMNETEQTALYWVSMYLKSFQMPDIELPYVTKLNRDEVIKVAKIVYSKYDPFLVKYEIASKTHQNQINKSVLIERNILQSDNEVKPTWSQFEEDFSMVTSDLSAIDQAPDSVQMNYMGMTILSAFSYHAIKKDRLLLAVEIYKKRFPSNPYNSVLSNLLSSSKYQNDTFESKFPDDIDSLRTSVFVDVSQMTNLEAVIKRHFPGKVVYVDFWASWCSPCIAEFKYEPSLRKFLQEKGIVMLYVSIDSPNDSEKWKRAIKKYNLSGHHCIVNKEMKSNLDEWFSGIPRYMLFDTKGDILADNLPNPSSKTELYEKINQLLK